jgi:hypothetical protein
MFEVFERNVKRFGYTGRLTDNLLKDIAEDIKLEFDEVKDRNTLPHFYW